MRTEIHIQVERRVNAHFDALIERRFGGSVVVDILPYNRVSESGEHVLDNPLATKARKILIGVGETFLRGTKRGIWHIESVEQKEGESIESALERFLIGKYAATRIQKALLRSEHKTG